MFVASLSYVCRKKRGKLTFNSLNKECNVMEELRAAYVVMTRLQKILIIALPKSVKKNFGHI